MSDIKFFLSQLQKLFPEDSISTIQKLAHFLDGVASGSITEENARGFITGNDDLHFLIDKLTGKSLQTPNTTVSFGFGNNIGDIVFRDIAGRDIVNISIMQHAKLDLSYIKLSLDQAGENLVLPIQLLTDVMVSVSQQIAALDQSLSLVMKTYDKERPDITKARVQAIAEGLETTFLRMAIKLDGICEKYQKAIAVFDATAQQFLEIDLYTEHPPLSAIANLQQELNTLESKIVYCRQSIFNMRHMLERLLIPKVSFANSNQAIELCQEKALRLSQNVQSFLQLIWRMSGTLNGYLNSNI